VAACDSSFAGYRVCATRPGFRLASRNVRLIFCLYLAVIAAGLAFYIVVGLTHH
jgi:hypothetical protein